MKETAFERMISKFLFLLSEHLYNLLVTTIAPQFKMSDVANEEQSSAIFLRHIMLSMLRINKIFDQVMQ